MIYEHIPLNPLTVRTVNVCPFDQSWCSQDEDRGFGFREARIRYRVFFPRPLRWLRGMEDNLGWLPMGAQYYVWGRK